VAPGFLAGWEALVGEAVFRCVPAPLDTAPAGLRRYVSPAVWDDAVPPLPERQTWVLPAGMGALPPPRLRR